MERWLGCPITSCESYYYDPIIILTTPPLVCACVCVQDCSDSVGCLGLTNLDWFFESAYFTCFVNTDNCSSTSLTRLLTSKAVYSVKCSINSFADLCWQQCCKNLMSGTCLRYNIVRMSCIRISTTCTTSHINNYSKYYYKC